MGEIIRGSFNNWSARRFEQQLLAAMADPVNYCESSKKVAGYKALLEALEQELPAVYKQLEELEALQG